MIDSRVKTTPSSCYVIIMSVEELQMDEVQAAYTEALDGAGERGVEGEGGGDHGEEAGEVGGLEKEGEA